MSEAAFDALGEELKEICKGRGITAFAIESAYEAAEGIRGEREKKLKALASPEGSTDQAYYLRLLFDVVAATA